MVGFSFKNWANELLPDYFLMVSVVCVTVVSTVVVVVVVTTVVSLAAPSVLGPLLQAEKANIPATASKKMNFFMVLFVCWWLINVQMY